MSTGFQQNSRYIISCHESGILSFIIVTRHCASVSKLMGKRAEDRQSRIKTAKLSPVLGERRGGGQENGCIIWRPLGGGSPAA